MKYVLAMLFAGVTTSTMATPFMVDLMEYEGASLSLVSDSCFLYKFGHSYPKSERYDRWLSRQHTCSANCQGRPVYKVVGKTIFLVGFRSCTETIKPSQIYPDQGDQIKATWLNGKIDASGGKYVCGNGMGTYLDKLYVFEVNAGDIASVNIVDDPRTKEICGKFMKKNTGK